MKYILALIIFLSLSAGLHGQCSKINFVDVSLDYAYSKANFDKKSVFIFIYEESDLKSDFFQSAIFYKNEICSVFNYKFVNVKAKKTSQMASEIIRQYNIHEFPAFVILDGNRVMKEHTHLIYDTQSLLTFARRN
ncbi:MAG: hypothetical protein V3V00_00870 [Saprospiraceae bacterium]